jgi:eukaryotic-like serine/threonine-protein kinase
MPSQRTQVERGVRRRRERDRLAPGTIVGPYAVEEAVAEGGFASLYRAVRLTDERPVALKVLHRDLAASPRVKARFRREAEAIRRLDHPRIVSVLDHGSLSDGRPYLVMEWVEGRPLSDELSARGRLPWPEVVDLVSQIADALESAHACGVIHRDLKAENVIVSGQSPRLSAVLVDFGLAKILVDEGSGGDVLTTASPMGTPLSMAPEQILSQEVDTRVDIYALGVLLFQMAAGRPPFSLPDLASLLEAHLHTPPPRLSDLVPASPEVDDLVARCLAKEPSDRPSTPAQAAAALRRAVGTRGVIFTAEVVEELCAAVYVVACPPDGGSTDATLDRLDDLVDEARTQLLAAGLMITWEIGNALLAVTPAAEPAKRRFVLERALALVGPELAVFVHADAARLVGGRCVGGPLCQIADWTDPRPIPGRVAATPAILDHLDRRVTEESLSLSEGLL